MMQSFFAMGLVTVLWALLGYTLAFGPDIAGLIGGMRFLGLDNTLSSTTGTIPTNVFVMFQGMFAVITAALISGAFAGRIKFKAYALFIGVWTLLVYSPLAHWVWGGGWLTQLGALDFAGGTVVHIASASAALAGVLVLGRRRDYGSESLRPHNLPLTLLGTGIL